MEGSTVEVIVPTQVAALQRDAAGDVRAPVVLRVQSSRGGIPGAEVHRLDPAPIRVDPQAPLVVTDARGVATWQLETPLPVVVTSPDYEPKTLLVEPGCEYLVSLVHAFEQEVTCVDRSGHALAGVRMAMTLGGVCEMADSGEPGVDPATAIHRGISDASGRIKVAGLHHGDHAVQVSPPAGYVLARSTTPSRMRLFVPSPPFRLIFDHLWTCVVQYQDDTVLAFQTAMTLGVAGIGPQAGRNVITLRDELKRQFEGSLVYVAPPREDWEGPRTVTVRACLRRRGWLPTQTFILSAPGSIHPQIVETAPLPLHAQDNSGTFLVRLLSPDGASLSLPRDDLVFVVSTGNRVSGALGHTDGAAPMRLASGRYVLTPVCGSIGWAFPEVPFEVAAGSDVIVDIVATEKLVEIPVYGIMQGSGALDDLPVMLLGGHNGRRRIGAKSLSDQRGRTLLLGDGLWRLTFFRDGCEPVELSLDAIPSANHAVLVEFPLRRL